jgi:hypothetical protein
MNRTFRVALLILLAVVIVYILFTIVFPWVDRTFITDPVVGANTAALIRS